MVDDHNLMRKGLVALVNSFGDYQVVMEAADGKEFTDRITADHRIDIAIIDLSMPVMDGYETLAWMARNLPEVRTIALTFDSSEAAVVKAMRTAARGFLLKDVDPDEFKRALDRVSDAGYYESKLMRHYLEGNTDDLTAYERQKARILSEISPRELDFIKEVCSTGELTYEQIAERLDVSASTIESRRKQIFDRFGIKSKAGLVIFAYRWGIVQVITEAQSNIS